MTKRLFLFAAYGYRDDIVDESKLAYIRALAALGDIVFFMANDTPQSELKKLKPYTIYTGAQRHGEYDFGSYKRGYIWARDNNILKKYDWVYMVNDSMYAPLNPILPLLTELESRGASATGMFYRAHKKSPHLQSWFIGMSPCVFLSKQFDTFITGVSVQANKGAITTLYETGFTKMVHDNGRTTASIFTVRGHAMYNRLKYYFRRGSPFMKKMSFVRHHGALGGQIKYILDHIDTKLSDAIVENASREFGAEYVRRTLTKNPIKIAWRKIRHAFVKLFKEGI